MNLENSSTIQPNEGEVNLNKCERVKACIESYLEKNPRLTLVNVEEKTTVPHSTLRRIMGNKSNPQPEAVIKIFRGLGFDQELYSYMVDFHPEISTVMAQRNSHNTEYQFIEDQNREYFLDESNFLILSLAYTTNGTTEEEIRYELGQRGIEKLSELISNKILDRLESGRIVGRIKDFKLPFADVKKRIEFALKHYRIDEAGSINNWMSYQSESLNEEGLKALKLLNQKQFTDRKEQVFNNAMYLGDIKVYSTAVSSTFLAFKDSGALK